MASIKRYAAPTMLVTLLSVIVIQLAFAAGDRFDALAWFDPIQDVLLEVRRDYVEELKPGQYTQLQTAAIQGMLDELHDPYTVYIPPAAQDDFDKNVRGQYVGIGAEVRVEDGWLTVQSPMPNSPAIRAGVKAGDQVRAIEGKSTKGEDINDSISRLMGEPDTDVVITVHRKGAPEDQTVDLTVTRGAIRVQTVNGVRRIGTDWDYWIDAAARIAYIRIDQFTQTTPAELDHATRGLIEQGMKGLILDLRFDPGGSLTAAIMTSDLFISDGVIVSVKGRNVNETYKAHERGTLPDFPMVVMVNAQSASASEIVSGALQDNNRAIVLGTRSFGKGLVQDVRPLPSGVGQIKITTASYYLPSGRNLHKWPDSETWGVDPNEGFFVPMTNDEYLAMLRVRNDLDVVRDVNEPGNWDDLNWVLDKLDDNQTALAVKAIQLRLEQGKWVPTGEKLDPTKSLIDELRTAQRQREYLIKQLDQVDHRLDSLSSLVEPEKRELPDLIPDEADLTDGTVQIRDKNGNVVATLHITDADPLEGALQLAQLEPEKQPERQTERPSTDQ